MDSFRYQRWYLVKQRSFDWLLNHDFGWYSWINLLLYGIWGLIMPLNFSEFRQSYSIPLKLQNPRTIYNGLDFVRFQETDNLHTHCFVAWKSHQDAFADWCKRPISQAALSGIEILGFRLWPLYSFVRTELSHCACRKWWWFITLPCENKNTFIIDYLLT